MADSTRDLLFRLKGDTSGLEKSLKGASTQLEETGTRTSRISEGLTKAGLALGAVGIGLTAFEKKAVDSTVAYATSVKTLARETGDTVEKTSELQYALKRFGVDGGEASALFGVLSKNIAAANDKTGDMALKQADLKNKMAATQEKITALTKDIKDHGDKTGATATNIEKLNIDLKQYQAALSDVSSPLQAMNIQTQNADGSTRQFSSVLLDIADKFKSMPDGVDKTALSMKLFGRAGKELIGFLDQGSAGIETLMKRADALGITLTSDNLAKVKQYTDAQKDMADSQQALTMRIGTMSLPMFTKFTQATNDMVSSLQDAPKPVSDLTNVVLAFGGPVFTAAGATLGFVANLDQAAPAISKVGMGIAGVTSKLGPWGLALTAIGLLAVGVAIKMGAFNGLIKDSGDETSTAAGKATLLALAQDHVARSTQAVKDAQAQLTKEQAAVVQSNSDVAKKQEAVAASQTGINNALTAFGENSPQYQAAVAALKDRQTELDDTLYNQLGHTLAVAGAQKDLRDANNELAGATKNLTDIQRLSAQGIDALVIKVASLGPIASMQVKPIATLIGQVDQLLGKMQNINQIQGQADAMNARLQGLGSTIDRLQTQGQNMVNTLQGASSAVQGGGGTAAVRGVVQARAGGGPVEAGHTYLVGEKGQELYVPKTDGYIVPNNQLSSPSSSAAAASVAPNVTITLAPNIGLYAGMPAERREIAVQLWQDLMKVARAQGVQLPNLNVAGIQ